MSLLSCNIFISVCSFDFLLFISSQCFIFTILSCQLFLGLFLTFIFFNSFRYFIDCFFILFFWVLFLFDLHFFEIVSILGSLSWWLLINYRCLITRVYSRLFGNLFEFLKVLNPLLPSIHVHLEILKLAINLEIIERFLRKEIILKGIFCSIYFYLYLYFFCFININRYFINSLLKFYSPLSLLSLIHEFLFTSICIDIKGVVGIGSTSGNP